MANIFTHQDQNYTTGDTVRLHLSVNEGDKTRIQIFEGIIIAIKGEGAGKSFTIRKIGAGGVGVERIMPVLSPTLTKIEKKADGHVRRSKLYYLRNRIGKQAMKVKTKDIATKSATAKASAHAKSSNRKAGRTTRQKAAAK